MAQAARLLGHPYIIIGKYAADGLVVHPEQEYKQLPPAGEYLVRVGEENGVLTITEDGSIRLNIHTEKPQKHDSIVIEFGV